MTVKCSCRFGAFLLPKIRQPADDDPRHTTTKEGSNAPVLGETVKLSASEKSRFSVYSDDFAGQDAQLFLTEMNRGKKYPENSRLTFFVEAFSWIMNNIIVISLSKRLTMMRTH